eukprot:s2636_g7.t1
MPGFQVTDAGREQNGWAADKKAKFSFADKVSMAKTAPATGTVYYCNVGMLHLLLPRLELSFVGAPHPGLIGFFLLAASWGSPSMAGSSSEGPDCGPLRGLAMALGSSERVETLPRAKGHGSWMG